MTTPHILSPRRGGRGELSDAVNPQRSPHRLPRGKATRVDSLGARRGYDPETDTVDDLFPGSGSVSAAISQGVLL